MNQKMTALLLQGLELTVLGMGVVFVLLTLLVGIVRAMSALCLRVETPGPAGGGSIAAPERVAPADAELIGVIAAAIAAHRSRATGS